jgi:hypothetical protein
LNITGQVRTNTGYQNKQGFTGATSADSFNLFYAAGLGQTQLWINGANTGTIAINSDYRIKKDVTNLGGMWDTVKKLRLYQIYPGGIHAAGCRLFVKVAIPSAGASSLTSCRTI